MLPIRSELGAAYTGDDVDAATTFRRDDLNLSHSAPFNEETVDQSGNFNCEVVEQPVASAQDLNQSYNLQPGTNQSEQGMSSRLLMRERQQSEEFVPYSTKDARLISTASISAASFADNEFFSIPNCNDV